MTITTDSNLVDLRYIRQVYISDSNPQINTNPAHTGFLWINQLSGEIFSCRDRTRDANVWVGSERTVIGDDLLALQLHLNKVFDYSVNNATIFKDHEDSLILEANKFTNEQGNFNGGGAGSKAIAGLRGWDGLPISSLPVIEADVEIRTDNGDADEVELGLSFNVLIDLQGNGDPADIVVGVISNTLNGVVDVYGKTSAAASVTTFDINSFDEGAGNNISDMSNIFYIVGNLPSHTGSANWFANPINLDILINGGTMPVTGETFSGGFPNAKTISAVSQDGGHPAGTKLTSIIAQIGDSSTDKRAVTAIKQLNVGGINYLT